MRGGITTKTMIETETNITTSLSSDTTGAIDTGMIETSLVANCLAHGDNDEQEADGGRDRGVTCNREGDYRQGTLGNGEAAFGSSPFPVADTFRGIQRCPSSKYKELYRDFS